MTKEIEMTTTEARNSINEKFQAGLISQDESSRAHRAISQINTGFQYGTRTSWKQQARLRAIWA